MRWVYRIIGILVVLVAVAVGALFLLPADRIAGLASDQFKAATGRTLTIEGSVRPTLYPEIGVSVGGVAIENAPWGENPSMISAQGLAVSVKLVPLLGGDIQVTGVTVQNPQIFLERNAEGTANWELTGAETAQTETAQTPGSGGGGVGTFSLDALTIEDGRVVYSDAASGTRYDLSDVGVTASLPSGGASKAKITAQLGNQPIEVTAEITSLEGLLGQGSAVAIQSAIGGSTVAFGGDLGTNPVAANGALNADLADMPAIFGAIGQPAPEIPEGFGQRAGLQGDLDYSADGGLSLTGATVVLDQNTIAGDVQVALDGKPKITAVLSAGDLDFSSLAADDGGDAADTGGSGWSTDPIDASALSAVDADVTLTAQSVDLGTTKLGRTRIRSVLTDGRLVNDITELQSYGGALSGQLVVNGRSDLSVGGDLSADGVRLQALFSDLLGFEKLVGSGDVRLKFLGSGNSMDAIMNSLSGDGSINFGKGEILGFDLVGMLTNLDSAFGDAAASTIFDAITASFDISNGVVNNVDLNFLAPLANALGSGTVGLGQQTLDYRIEPRLLSGEAAESGISVPIVITGSWASPRIRPDLSGLVDAKLDAELKAAEDKAKAKVQERLGLSEGESAEDKVKEKLTDEIGKGLGKLFGD